MTLLLQQLCAQRMLRRCALRRVVATVDIRRGGAYSKQRRLAQQTAASDASLADAAASGAAAMRGISPLARMTVAANFPDVAANTRPVQVPRGHGALADIVAQEGPDSLLAAAPLGQPELLAGHVWCVPCGRAVGLGAKPDVVRLQWERHCAAPIHQDAVFRLRRRRLAASGSAGQLPSPTSPLPPKPKAAGPRRALKVQ